MPAAHIHNASTDLTFPQKLYTIVLQEPEVFKWNVGHESFRIIDEGELVQRILQQHFRTNRFSSFTRNLNIYGFKKIAKGEFAGSYYHPDFKKDGAAVSCIRRCGRKPAGMAPAIKVEPRTENHEPQISASHIRLDESRSLLMGSCDESSFWLENDFGLEHELALPVSPDEEHSTDIGACCSTQAAHNLMEDDLAEDTDLAEWKKVLCFTSVNCPVPSHPQQQQVQQHQQPASSGANAYCVHVPAGPLGVTLECQGDKVFLSKVDHNSPLAHVPVGAQLVNLDGKDTTKMLGAQISKLDELTCHRNRMVIFTLAQCWDAVLDTALLAVTPTLPQCTSWGAPKAKCMHTDDVSMESNACSDTGPQSGSPSPSNNSSGWLQCLYEAM